ncbi:alpha/beta fold hydrolase [Oleiagrimonas citrea]|uniref:Alpha/beta fold hydrolase n=1 Tax=Oleiagrimonas citrea TaxID=1665687 RepID=A0A846ZLT9_9GAMM|nr:alpha/beta fold hydrolase [Oleiagrimonas citrea]NKZ38946.1 alpha/beta fold hydrolase [Oleiagrimonas citrea]
MKRLAFLAACLVALPSFAQSVPNCMQRSQQLLDALKAHNYAAATKHFDAQVAAVVTPDRLEQVWARGLPMRFGDYDGLAKGQAPKRQPDGVIVTPLHFARGWFHMRVTCNAKGAISGFRFLPGRTARPGEAEHAGPKAAHGDWGTSTPIEVTSPWGPLPGLLTLPKGKGPFPAVVLVGGSGPHDYDEAIGPNKPFRDIARGLAAHGIASLRYDKRTYAFPQRSERDMRMTIDKEVTDDAITAAHQLASHANIDLRRVFLVGHSLGAMLAPRIGRRDPSLAGLVLLAAPARSLLTVIGEQTRELGPGRGLSPQRIAKAEAARRDERKLLASADPAHPPKGRYLHAPQSYWMSLRDYDQVAVARSLHMPMLFLQGKADFQVSPTHDFARWKQVFANDPAVHFQAYPGLSHLFMHAGKTRTVADYMKPRHVAPKVIDDMAAWILKQSPRTAH